MRTRPVDEQPPKRRRRRRRFGEPSPPKRPTVKAHAMELLTTVVGLVMTAATVAIWLLYMLVMAFFLVVLLTDLGLPPHVAIATVLLGFSLALLVPSKT